jgi:hypothetical protein
MGGGLLRRIPPARLYLGATVLIGLLVAVVTVAQMALLSEIVNRVFLNAGGRERVVTLLLMLAETAVLRAGLLWVRETTAQQGAVRDRTEHYDGNLMRTGAKDPGEDVQGPPDVVLWGARGEIRCPGFGPSAARPGGGAAGEGG